MSFCEQSLIHLPDNIKKKPWIKHSKKKKKGSTQGQIIESFHKKKIGEEVLQILKCE